MLSDIWRLIGALSEVLLSVSDDEEAVQVLARAAPALTLAGYLNEQAPTMC